MDVEQNVGPLAPALPEDEGFMRLALEAARAGGSRFGAVIVQEGELLAAAGNERRRTGDPTAHAEIVAIRAAAAARGPSALVGATVYATGEPCPMCAAACVYAGIGRIVFGASIAELAAYRPQIAISCAEVVARAPFAEVSVTGGVLAEEALALFGEGSRPWS